MRWCWFPCGSLTHVIDSQVDSYQKPIMAVEKDIENPAMEDVMLEEEEQPHPEKAQAKDTPAQPCCEGQFRWESVKNGYRSYRSRASAFSVFSVNALLSIVSVNAAVGFLAMNVFISILSINAFLSILSVNSMLSILSVNSFMAIGCTGESFKICYGGA